MTTSKQSQNSPFRPALRATTAPAFILLLLIVALAPTQSAQAQTYKVLHNFTAHTDGAAPAAGLTLDAKGDLYGTTAYTVFRLAQTRTDWVFSTLNTL